VECSDRALAAALWQKLRFTQEELANFELEGLSKLSYVVRSDGKAFKPVGTKRDLAPAPTPPARAAPTLESLPEQIKMNVEGDPGQDLSHELAEPAPRAPRRAPKRERSDQQLDAQTPQPFAEEPESTLNIRTDEQGVVKSSDALSPHAQITDDDYRQIMLSGTKVLDTRAGNKRSHLFDNADSHIGEDGAPTTAKARRPSFRKLGLDLEEAKAIAEINLFEHDSELSSAIGTPRNEDPDEGAGKAASRAETGQQEKPPDTKQETEAVEILMGHLFPIAMSPPHATNNQAAIGRPLHEPARRDCNAKPRQAEPRQGAASASRTFARSSEEVEEEVAEVLVGHLFPISLPPGSAQGAAVVGQPSDEPLKPTTSATVHPSPEDRGPGGPGFGSLEPKQRLMGHLFPVHLSAGNSDPPSQEQSNPAAAHDRPSQPSSPEDAAALGQIDGLNAPQSERPQMQRGSSRSLVTSSSGRSESMNTSSNYSDAEFVPAAGDINLPGHSYPLLEPQVPILDRSALEAREEGPVPLIGHVSPVARPSSSRPAMMPPHAADPSSNGTLPNGNPEITQPIGHLYYPPEEHGEDTSVALAPQSCEAVFTETGEAAEDKEGRLMQEEELLAGSNPFSRPNARSLLQESLTQLQHMTPPPPKANPPLNTEEDEALPAQELLRKQEEEELLAGANPFSRPDAQSLLLQSLKDLKDKS